jgi:hypothetical protein
MKKRGAWFGTAGETIAWFRQRRSAKFENTDAGAEAIRVRTSGHSEELPGLDLKIVDGSLQPAMASRG